MAHASERLVNLTVALLEARRPLTFEEIRSRTGYYGQDDHESARRMFERDKDALRRLGVPLETRGLDAFDAELGYIIDRGAYELPDVDLDPEETTALALALRVTGEDAARLALAKVSARAADPSRGDVDAPARIELGGERLDEVADAVVRRQAIRFRYRSAAGEESVRTVDPYAVVHRRGAWYLVCRDHDRNDRRSFRFDRITGSISELGEPGAFEVPEGLEASAAVGVQDEVDADLAIDPSLAAEAEARGGRLTDRTYGDWPVYRIPNADRWRTLSWVLGLGPRAIVLGPEELRDEVRRRLREVVEAFA